MRRPSRFMVVPCLWCEPTTNWSYRESARHSQQMTWNGDVLHFLQLAVKKRDSVIWCVEMRGSSKAVRNLCRMVVDLIPYHRQRSFHVQSLLFQQKHPTVVVGRVSFLSSPDPSPDDPEQAPWARPPEHHHPLWHYYLSLMPVVVLAVFGLR